eukprot:1157906-Pelagomonas_calceolata.AAC.1
MQLTLPYDTWRQPAPSVQQQSASDLAEAPFSPQHHHHHITRRSPSFPLGSDHGQPLLSDTQVTGAPTVNDTSWPVAVGSDEGGSAEDGTKGCVPVGGASKDAARTTIHKSGSSSSSSSGSVASSDEGGGGGGGDDLRGIGVGSSSSSSSSSTSEGETAAPGAQASVCLPEGARAAAAQIAAATAAAAASAEPRQSTGGDEDCSSNSSSVGSGAGCGSVESKIRSSASGNAGALGDDGAGSSTSSNNFGNEAVLAIQAELEPHGPGSNVHAVGHGIPSLDGRADSGSNPLSRLLDVRPHISSLALTGGSRACSLALCNAIVFATEAGLALDICSFCQHELVHSFVASFPSIERLHSDCKLELYDFINLMPGSAVSIPGPEQSMAARSEYA